MNTVQRIITGFVSVVIGLQSAPALAMQMPTDADVRTMAEGRCQFMKNEHKARCMDRAIRQSYLYERTLAHTNQHSLNERFANLQRRRASALAHQRSDRSTVASRRKVTAHRRAALITRTREAVLACREEENRAARRQCIVEARTGLRSSLRARGTGRTAS